MLQTTGIHHITAMCGQPQANIDFYAGLLGLRLVKVTVNFDDPGTYHLYYGDGRGTPGTLITFFPWPQSAKGLQGTGQVGKVAFTVPSGSLDFWEQRLTTAGIAPLRDTRFGTEEFLAFADHDGMLLELVASSVPSVGSVWEGGGIAQESAITGFHHAELWLKETGPTEEFLTKSFGATRQKEVGHRIRMQLQGGEPNQLLDLMHLPGRYSGRLGSGSIHHIAMRVSHEEEQPEWQELFAGQGLRPTPVQERDYFRSIYLREPGHVLFEMATDGPGFAIDEPVEELASGLRLPTWLEPRRALIEQNLSPITLPSGVQLP